MPDQVEELPDILTPVSSTDVADALVEAWRRLWGDTPRRESVLVLLAQSALETGRWRSIHGWNLGNVKGAIGDGRDWAFFRCSEIIDGKEVWFTPKHPACRFRAFRSLLAGALDYLSILRKRFAPAWPFVLSGDPVGFVHALKAAHYFSAAEGPYAHSVASLFWEFKGSAWEPKPSDAPLSDDERARVLALVAITSRELTDPFDDAQPDTQPDPDLIFDDDGQAPKA